MFERFTDRARRVIVLAQEEARLLNHDRIGTAHLLLGLIREGEGVAARALESMDITLETLRQQVVEIIGRGQTVAAGHIPFTPRAKKVLELSLREALQLGHNYIGTEHLLLGLIREGEGVAAQVLQKVGADLNTVRQAVIQLLSGYAAEEEPRQPFRTPRAVKLRPMIEDVFEDWMAWAIGDYARDDAEAHGTRVDIERKRREIAELLPDGFETDGHLFRVAEDEESGERVGLLWFARRRTEADEVCQLFDLYVNDAMRGRGYARAMMRALEDEARAMGLSRIELNVFAFNDRARNLYESLGFVEIARQMYKVLPEA